MWIMASLTNDSDDSTLFSRSLLRRRHRPSQGNVRSTVHRIGNFTQPSASFGRRTMLRSQSAFASTHSYSFMLWYFESAYFRLTLLIGWPSSLPNSSAAALASSTSAAVTSTASSSPMLSTTMWRLRPSTFLWLSRPRSSPPEVVSTDWLSTLAVVRGEYGFSAARTLVRSESWMRSRGPLCRHSSKYRQTVLFGGKSLGRYRHWQPVRSTYRTASTTSRRSVVRGRPPPGGCGSRGPIPRPCSSLRSLG